MLRNLFACMGVLLLGLSITEAQTTRVPSGTASSANPDATPPPVPNQPLSTPSPVDGTSLTPDYRSTPTTPLPGRFPPGDAPLPRDAKITPSEQNATRRSLTRMDKPPLIDPLIKVTKVHEFKNDEKYNAGGNIALSYEQSYWNFGAITGGQFYKKRGHYFVISWVNKGAKADFTARLEYRQVRSKAVVRTLVLEHPGVQGSARSTFAVTGDAYAVYGPVSSYRFVVLRNGQIVGEDKSFVW